MATICDFCKRSVLESGKSWDFHQRSFDSLKKAAKSHCMFCSALAVEVEEEDKHTDFLAGAKWPLHRWSVRSLGRIRESKEAVAVTFRPIPRGDDYRRDGKRGGSAVDSAFPERIFYLFPEQDLGHISSEGDLGTSTSPEISGRTQIKKWIKNCDQNHKHCPAQNRPSGSFVPTRLLALGGERKGLVRVVETEPNDIRGPYVSLSHCWGLIPFVKLTTKNKKQFMEEGIPWDELPKNFQEAIEVARFLEIEYIWIDSLCIIQGDNGDFREQAPLMHKVYRNSYCNIAAADSSDSTGGLFRNREAHHVLPARYQAEGKSPMFGNRVWRIVSEDLWNAQLLQTSIYKRGWVFQERMLSPRILHFTKHQIFWDCAEMSSCETLPSGLPQALDRAAISDRHWRGRLQESGSLGYVPVAGANDDSIEHFWRSAVLRYTSCNLTKGSDKLIAIWGIAKLVRDILGEEYGAGLWEKNLEEQLAWRVAECELDERPKELSHNPSWSWASMRGTILLPDRVQAMRCYVVKDHQNHPISVQLIGKRRAQLHREILEGWQEELDAMNNDIRSLEVKHRDISGKGQDKSRGADRKQSKEERDQEPELQDKSIKIQGHIGRARLRQNEMTRRWTLELLDSPGADQRDAVIEAFPDVKPKEGDSDDGNLYFAVLAMSEVRRENEMPALRRLRNTDEEDIRYSGVGIMLKPSGQECHFERIGAIQFHDLNARLWEHLQATAGGLSMGNDRVNGLKFWLD